MFVFLEHSQGLILQLRNKISIAHRNIPLDLLAKKVEAQG